MQLLRQGRCLPIGGQGKVAGLWLHTAGKHAIGAIPGRFTGGKTNQPIQILNCIRTQASSAKDSGTCDETNTLVSAGSISFDQVQAALMDWDAASAQFTAKKEELKLWEHYIDDLAHIFGPLFFTTAVTAAIQMTAATSDLLPVSSDDTTQVYTTAFSMCGTLAAIRHIFQATGSTAAHVPVSAPYTGDRHKLALWDHERLTNLYGTCLTKSQKLHAELEKTDQRLQHSKVIRLCASGQAAGLTGQLCSMLGLEWTWPASAAVELLLVAQCMVILLWVYYAIRHVARLR